MTEYTEPTEEEPEVVEEEEVSDEELNTPDLPVNEIAALEEPADPEKSPAIEGDPHARLESGLDEPEEETGV